MAMHLALAPKANDEEEEIHTSVNRLTRSQSVRWTRCLITRGELHKWLLHKSNMNQT